MIQNTTLLTPYDARKPKNQLIVHIKVEQRLSVTDYIPILM